METHSEQSFLLVLYILLCIESFIGACKANSSVVTQMNAILSLDKRCAGAEVNLCTS